MHNITTYCKLSLRALATVVLLMASHSAARAFDADTYASESKLASGRWVKISVDRSGLYAISQSDLSKWGFSDINKVKIYGYGGAPLAESLRREDIIDDLPALPVVRSGNRIIFYAQGHITKELNSKGVFVPVQHPYANAAYYFVTENDSDDAAFATSETAVNPSAEVVTSFTDMTFHEVESSSAGETGRQLLGEDFKYNSSQSFKFDIPGYIAGSTIRAYTAFACSTSASANLTFKYNGTQLANGEGDIISPIVNSYQLMRLNYSLKEFQLNDASNFTYTIGLGYSGTLKLANLDYIAVNYPRSIALANGSLLFNHSANTATTIVVSGANADTHIWDITDSANPIVIKTEAADGGVKFAPVATGLREYAAFDADAKFPAPVFVGNVSSQNIHGQPTPDMIIITPSAFADQARRVAAIHEQRDNMRVLVLNQELIFNEFSSGTPDAMAYRRLCKMFYDRGTDDEGHRLAYLLLFGGGSFDNRQLTLSVKSNSFPMLLTYQSVDSSNESSSFCSDDLFVMLEDNASGFNNKCSIAVGRMPARSYSQARNNVDKLIKYINNTDLGSWKANVMIAADDQNDGVHMEQAESIINLYTRYGGENNIYNRVYIDAFDLTTSGSGLVSEGGRKRFYNWLNEGTMWLSYIGHASPTGWTGESLLTYTDINSLYNRRWPFVFAATCEFSRFDAGNTSGGEIIYNNPNGGAIAELSSTRLAYIPNNGALNNAVAKYVFLRDENGEVLPIGEIVRKGKNDLMNDENKLRYVLFGDPAMRLTIPKYVAEIETINGHDINSDDMPTFQARQSLTFTGKIVDLKGNPIDDFNGKVVSTLFDAEKSVETQGHSEQYGELSKQIVYQERDNKLAINTDNVTNGRFSITVTIPSEISPESYNNYSPARIMLYAYDETTHQEAMGSNEQFYIYGYDETIENDSEGPEIRVFALNTESFADGDDINESPLVLANVFDKDGINFSTGGIGHNITLQLDEKVTYSDVDLYYRPVFDPDGNAGTINYPLSNLTDGQHSLRLKVWDVFGNSSEKTITFNVVKGLKPEMLDVYTTANPASTEAVFYVQHNRPDAVLNISLQVFDLMGRLVWSTSETGKSDLYTSAPITWNLCDNNGNRVPRGIYVYRASIMSNGMTQSSKAKKLAVTGY